MRRAVKLTEEEKLTLQQLSVNHKHREYTHPGCGHHVTRKRNLPNGNGHETWLCLAVKREVDEAGFAASPPVQRGWSQIGEPHCVVPPDGAVLSATL